MLNTKMAKKKRIFVCICWQCSNKSSFRDADFQQDNPSKARAGQNSGSERDRSRFRDVLLEKTVVQRF